MLSTPPPPKPEQTPRTPLPTNALSPENEALPLGIKSGKAQQRAREIDIIQIVEPDWLPRKYTNLEELEGLKQSVQTKGVLVPIIVRPHNAVTSQDVYELVSGLQRLKAAKKAGLATVPVIIKPLSLADAMLHALIDDALHKKLGELEQTEAIVNLVGAVANEGKTEVIALLHQIGKQYRKIGHNVMPQKWVPILKIFSALNIRPDSFRSNKLPMLNWPEDVKKAFRDQEITCGHARELAQIKNDSERLDALIKAVENGATVKELKGMRREIEGAQKPELCPKDLKSKAEKTFANLKKSDVWNCPTRKEELAALLRKMNALIAETDNVEIG